MSIKDDPDFKYGLEILGAYFANGYCCLKRRHSDGKSKSYDTPGEWAVIIDIRTDPNKIIYISKSLLQSL